MAILTLPLIHGGVTATELAGRFAAMDAARPEAAAELLERLAHFGLVRVASIEGTQLRYVLTTLGQQYADQMSGDHPELFVRLEELERLRTDLLSTIAHELRTPLTALRTSVGLLLDPAVKPDPDARMQLLRTAEQSAERMQRLVADVLDLARFRVGGVHLQLRRFDACALVTDTERMLSPLLQARSQRLSLTLPQSPVWVFGDRRRLEQALLNLLSNAHKYSPDGSEVGLLVETHGEAVTWSVTDRGQGIDADDQVRLFERFFTTASDSTSRGAGTGLGLPIALAIAQAHGGNIEVESAVGQGSVFTLRIPKAGPSREGEL